jgi:hypothetical protein
MFKTNLGQCTPTSCPKAGIKIHESNNDYKRDPFFNEAKGAVKAKNEVRGAAKEISIDKQVDSLNKQLANLDLNLDNYELNDIYTLFMLNSKYCLTDQMMKDAKKVVLKMHPDKSKLDPQVFRFYSAAYKRLFEVYQFQNKSIGDNSKKETTYQNLVKDMREENKTILNNLFDNNKDLKESKNFNAWFNERFDKYRVEDDRQNGYGEWLKSNDDFSDLGSENITQANMNQVFERKKMELQALTVYNGIQENQSSFGSNFGSFDTQADNYSSNDYTDLKHAYTHTLIPVTEEDFRKAKRYNNVESYKHVRDTQNLTPLDPVNSMTLIKEKEYKESMKGQSVAYKWAKQIELSKQNNNLFWYELKQIKN